MKVNWPLDWLSYLKTFTVRTDIPAKYFVGAFALLALTLGTAYAPLLAPFQVPDEPAHMYRAYATANFSCVGSAVLRVPHALVREQDLFPAGLEKFPLASRRGAVNELRNAFNGQPLGPPYDEVRNYSGNLYSCVPYLPTAVAIRLGKIIRAPVLILFYAGRLANLITFTLLTSVALLIMPVCRFALMVVALLPMTLQQAASFSADALTISLSFLFFAYCFRLAFGCKLLAPRQYAILCALTAALTLCKFNVWFIFLFLLIPVSYFRSGRERLALFVGLVFLPCGVAVAWQKVNEGNIRRYEAYRSKVADVSIADNANELAHSPKLVAASAVETLANSYHDYIDTFIGRLGPLSISLPSWVTFICKLLLIITIFLKDGVTKLRLHDRALLLCIAVASLASIFGLLWVFETTRYLLAQASIGHGVVSGFQGRYFLPLAPLVLVALSWPRLNMGRLGPLLISAALLVTNGEALSSVKHAYFDDIGVGAQIQHSAYEGKLIRTAGKTNEDSKIYIVAGGRKYWITEGAWIKLYGFSLPDDLCVIDRKALEQIPDGGTISMAAARTGVALPLLPDTAASRYEGKLVRSTPFGRKDDRVFLITQGRKRWITRGSWLDEHGYTFSDVIFVSPDELGSIKDGDAIQ